MSFEMAEVATVPIFVVDSTNIHEKSTKFPCLPFVGAGDMVCVHVYKPANDFIHSVAFLVHTSVLISELPIHKICGFDQMLLDQTKFIGYPNHDYNSVSTWRFVSKLSSQLHSC